MLWWICCRPGWCWRQHICSCQVCCACGLSLQPARLGLTGTAEDRRQLMDGAHKAVGLDCQAGGESAPTDQTLVCTLWIKPAALAPVLCAGSVHRSPPCLRYAPWHWALQLAPHKHCSYPPNRW